MGLGGSQGQAVLRLAMLPMPGALRGVSVFAIGFGTVGAVPARVSVTLSVPRVNITASRSLSGRWYLGAIGRRWGVRKGRALVLIILGIRASAVALPGRCRTCRGT
jgi:hypothetical protein